MQIPLHSGGNRRDPGVIVAYAQVDPEDYAALNESRWCLNAKGYAQRTVSPPVPATCPECGWEPAPGVWTANGVAAHRIKKHGMGRTAPRRTVLMHRVVLGLEHGDPRTGDHMNRDRLDNRRANLRIIPATHQAHNQCGLAVFNGHPTESPYRGVGKVKKNGVWTGRWKAVVAGHYLGCFPSEEAAAEAAAAYRLATMAAALD